MMVTSPSRRKAGLLAAIGLELMLDREKDGDEVMNHEHAAVLLVDPEMSALIVTDRIFDCWRTRTGRVQFFLRRLRIGEQPSSPAA